MKIKSKLGIFIVFIITSLLLTVFFTYTKIRDYSSRKNIELINRETAEKAKTNPSVDKTLPESNSSSNSPTAYLKVPFICQAPLETEANWKLHEESCEEAALLQAYLYETGKSTTKTEANEIILNMIDWQRKNLGGHHDLYAEDMKKFITGYYKLSDNEVEIILDADIEDIKMKVSSGHPVIVPITGDILKNPYYPYPGYHMLTVIGYTKDRIITNDNGTRRGADFSYDIQTFQKAMKDAGGNVLVLDLIKK